MEGVVLSKEITTNKNHPKVKQSADEAEDRQRREAATRNRYAAEIRVRVDNWIVGNGPPEILLRRGINFTPQGQPPPEEFLSSDWGQDEYENTLRVGARYRIHMNRVVWLEGPYFVPGDIEPL